MTLHYGFSKQAAERGLLKQRREKFNEFKDFYNKIFPKSKQTKWENKVKSNVNKIKKMSTQGVAKLIRREYGPDSDLSTGLNYNEYRDVIRNHVLKDAEEKFTNIFGMPYEQLFNLVKSKADQVSELFGDRKYAAKMAEMMNRVEYTGDPEKLVESYRRTGNDGMYDFTKEKISKINKLLKSDPETYGGRDTIKDTTGLLKRKYINQGYSPEVAQQMAEEEAGAIGAPGAIDKLDKRHPNPFTDFSPRNDRELLYNTTEPGSPLDPKPMPMAKDYIDSPENPQRSDLQRDVGQTSTTDDSPMRSEYLRLKDRMTGDNIMKSGGHLKNSSINPFKRY